MKIFLFFLMGVIAITLHFTIRLGGESLHYFSLKKQAKAKITQWEIVEIKGRFALKAGYTFEAQEKNCPGSYTLNPPHYLNEGAALSGLKEKAKESWTVWYNPKNVKTSALEKSFPVGLLIRTFICFSVLIYFITLRRKVAITETS